MKIHRAKQGGRTVNLTHSMMTALILWFAVFLLGLSNLYSSVSIAEKHSASATSPKDSDRKGLNNIDNPWYGWQPEISSDKDCSWRQCFRENHKCTTCRDSINDFANPPPAPKDWVPDVTMLRRMFLDGHDDSGKEWPPPLDDELCEPIGYSGGKLDDNKKLLDVVPIVGQPFSKKSEGKLLCLVYTMESKHATNIRAIRETWASGCDGFLAFSTKSDPRIPAISLPHNGKEEYNNMWQKVRSIWNFVGNHYIDQFEWFYIGGEDLFVIPQNLKNYLATFPSNEPYFLGRRFKAYGDDEYFNSGGAGYTLSRPSLQCYLDNFENEAHCSPDRHTPTEDVQIAKCLRKACGINIYDTRDDQKRERFHPFAPGGQLNWQPPAKGGSDWYETYNREWGLLLGKECCAPDSVSFHYIKKPAMVRHLFHYSHACKEEREVA
jgi:glycoprotein-N-acetylgalactosamine 3-beta-galactosyltransferase